jgi:hypothetical protein
MSLEIDSHEIISACLKEHGKAELFFRTDGLQFEERRALARREYLESHPRIEPGHREAILKAAATPGMSREEITAAWGLLDEDTRVAFGHVTSDRFSAYAYFTGLSVGTNYALYLKDDIVLGIRESNDLVPPHEQELDMRLAEEESFLRFFYEGSNGLIGSDYDQHRIDWDTLHLHLYTIDPVPPYSAARIEGAFRRKGLQREYEFAFVRKGYDSWSAPREVRQEVLLGIYPFPIVRAGDSSSSAKKTEAVRPGIRGPIALPAPEVESSDPAMLPPAAWFKYIATGHIQEGSFPTIDGGFELLQVYRLKERLFHVKEVPLLANGIAPYDLVELEWQNAEVIPRFKRVDKRSGHRTIRALVNEDGRGRAIKRFAELNAASYRYEKKILAFAISEPGLDQMAKEWLSYLPVSWIYTDTLSQE